MDKSDLREKRAKMDKDTDKPSFATINTPVLKKLHLDTVEVEDYPNQFKDGKVVKLVRIRELHNCKFPGIPVLAVPVELVEQLITELQKIVK